MIELNETAEKNATAMTGKEKPNFKSEAQRHRVISENYMGTVVRFLQAANFMMGEMYELLQELRDILKKTVKEEQDGEQ